MSIKVIAISIIAVLAPIKAVMMAAFALVVFDLITGVMAARKRGESISSAGFSRTMAKTCLYQTAIVTGFLCETYLTGPMLPASKIITSYIGLTELLSIIENLNEISGGSLFKTLLQRLESANVKKD